MPGKSSIARWRVDYLGKKAQHLGHVEAATEREAIDKAAEQFRITPARRFKIAVTRFGGKNGD